MKQIRIRKRIRDRGKGRVVVLSLDPTDPEVRLAKQAVGRRFGAGSDPGPRRA